MSEGGRKGKDGHVKGQERKEEQEKMVSGSRTSASVPGVAQGAEVIGIPTDEGMDAKEKVDVFLKGSVTGEKYKGWGNELFSNSLALQSASSQPVGSTTFTYIPRSSDCNRLGNVHGGCIATIFDICTTTALAPIAKPGYWAYAGVTRTLSVTYIRPVAHGQKVVVQSEVVHAGKRMCSLKGVMRGERDGEVLATCEHGKVSIDPVPTKL